MASPTTTFRLTPRDRRYLEDLADELLCSRADVLRLGMAELRRDRPLRRQIRADNLARAFLQSLRTQYGPNAVLELSEGPEDPSWKLAGEPLDSSSLDVIVRPQGEQFVMDLIDVRQGVGIYNVQVWGDEDDVRHAVVPLSELWVHSAHALIGEPTTHMTYDGRTVVEIEEEDGPPRMIVLDHKGNSEPIKDPGLELPVAVEESAPTPSVGIGVRRESKAGPHLGRGWGGRWHLTEDLDVNRQVVVDALATLIKKTENGELDGILDFRAERNQLVPREGGGTAG